MDTDFDLLDTSKDPIFVYGLGLSGSAVAKTLKKHKIPLIVWDDNEERRAEFIKDGYTVEDRTQNLDGCSALIPAAGIPPSHDTIERAQQSGCPIFSDIDLLYSLNPNARFIAITGTNGKSTATALLGHIFNACDQNYDMGGNIGRPAAALKDLNADGTYILELSSYQLHYTQQSRFQYAAIINITDDDHLTWHDGVVNYATAKARILRDNTHSVIGIDTLLSRDLIENIQNEVTPISAQLNLENGICVIDKSVYINNAKQADLNAPYLPGQHNDQNIATCIALATLSGLEFQDIIKAIESFKGLEHRQELCGTIDYIRFINDSKATNASSTERALVTYENIFLIAGGVAKETGLDSLSDHFNRIHKVYLIGQASDLFAKQIEGQLLYTKCEVMEKAVHAAFKEAMSQDDDAVILLSPACASFDQYKSFEKRGDDFKAIVSALLNNQDQTHAAG